MLPRIGLKKTLQNIVLVLKLLQRVCKKDVSFIIFVVVIFDSLIKVRRQNFIILIQFNYYCCFLRFVVVASLEMVNKCVVYGCYYGHTAKKRKRDSTGGDVSCDNNKTAKSSSHFPSKDTDPELRNQWILFVNRKDWQPSDHSVICHSHFDEKFLLHGKKKTNLRWELQPLPTIYPAETPSSLTKSVNFPRKLPKLRMSDLPDEYQEYLNSDQIDNFEDLNEGCGPESYLFQKFDDYCVYYNIEFSHNSPPQVRHSIIVDIHLHVKLFFRGSRVPTRMVSQMSFLQTYQKKSIAKFCGTYRSSSNRIFF